MEIKRLAIAVSIVALTATATGCASMTHKQRNTAIGAGAGAIAGSILTDGDPLAVVGGAAVGGLIGYKTTPSHHH
ncbi:MAG: glycine zipper 2TM domain-containing protein [Paludibacterium sp.]|uniref:glycine zipper 2TM domain-containing protein n=1 Tax=Paludibacterium sp. TaxID=1917523 RepID=UPI0025CE9162|nr:glycine zipper 2TM domain-containing protein [Paludibacterium sp.]MBV8045639.1 glycine zipper 2TM domain-containing protein [Paludibacterium sp.]MBV8647531.1 glycine zipper 2TM domain-containing protein [Paludibacterium sp.]